MFVTHVCTIVKVYIYPINVRLGEFDISNEIDQQDCVTPITGGIDCTEGAVFIPIEKIIPHRDYDFRRRRIQNNIHHEIALLRMSKSTPYSCWLIFDISVCQAAVSNKNLPSMTLNLTKSLTCLRQITMFSFALKTSYLII